MACGVPNPARNAQIQQRSSLGHAPRWQRATLHARSHSNTCRIRKYLFLIQKQRLHRSCRYFKKLLSVSTNIYFLIFEQSSRYEILRVYYGVNRNAGANLDRESSPIDTISKEFGGVAILEQYPGRNGIPMPRDMPFGRLVIKVVKETQLKVVLLQTAGVSQSANRRCEETRRGLGEPHGAALHFRTSPLVTP
jgi:hypothetical protein